MAFPKRFLGITIGWQDRGEVGGVINEKKLVKVYSCCASCKSIVHIGIEDGTRFKFCPKCLLKD